MHVLPVDSKDNTGGRKKESRKLATYNDLNEVVGLPRGPVFPGHLCSASKDRLIAGLKTR